MPNFTQFQVIREELLNELPLDLGPGNRSRNSSYLDLGEHNLYKLGYLIEQPTGASKHQNNLSFNTKGVRDSLRKVLGTLKTVPNSYIIYLPVDTYYRYFEIVEESKLPYQTYTCQNSIKEILQIEDDYALVILTDPLFPYGRFLDSNEVDLLEQWLGQSPGRMLFVDGVYNLDSGSLFQEKSIPNTFYSHSLAKTYLMPETAGNITFHRPRGNAFKGFTTPFPPGAFGCEPWLLPSDSETNQKIHNNRELPGLQRRLFDDEWRKLTKRLQTVNPDWSPPYSYFSTLPLNYLDLLQEHRILAIPLSVLGPNQPGPDQPGPNQPGPDQPSPDQPGPDEQRDPNGQRSEETSIITCLGPMIDRERSTMYHVSTVANFARGYDKYAHTFSKTKIPESTFPEKFHLLRRSQLEIGLEKANQIMESNQKKGIADKKLVLRTALSREEFGNLKPSESGLGQYLSRNWIQVESIHEGNGSCKPLVIEDVMAESLKMITPTLYPYEKLVPRTVSLLPIAQGCQASCPFCFSHASISDDVLSQNIKKQMPRIQEILDRAKEAGAIRAVITGGGEPGLVPHHYLCQLVKECASRYEETTIITNGYMLSQRSPYAKRPTGGDLAKRLQQLVASGLNVLAISRHGYNEEVNTKLMNLETESHLIAECLRNSDLSTERPHLTLRWICVLQKGGVEDMRTLELYMDFVKESGVTEVCFKELYFSTSVESVYHNSASNLWSLAHQVPLKLVLDFVEKYQLTEKFRLPWGAIVFDGEYKGHYVQVAAYTEPSVYWERSNGICRSWNLMADGQVYASLEDKGSLLRLSH